MFCSIAAERVEYRCCAFYHPHQPVLQQIRLLTSLNVVGETHNTAFQLVLPQCRKTSCTFSFRLRAVSLFCSPSSKRRDTQMARRVRPRFARLAASPLLRACIALSLPVFTEVLDGTVDRIIHFPVNKLNGKYYLLDTDSSSGWCYPSSVQLRPEK